MCGTQRTTVSPSSSSTSRSTPCVAGCCGPMLISMCSPSSSGSTAGGALNGTRFPASSVASGTRCGRPCASRPVVESSTSTVRVFVAMLLSHLLARAQPLTLLERELVIRLQHGQLLHRVLGLGIQREDLPELLGAAEPSTEREVLPQREAFLVLLPHQDAAQIRMAVEADAEHVVALALHPIGTLVDRPDARHDERLPLEEQRLQPQEAAVRQRAQMPDDLDRPVHVAVLDRRDVDEIVVPLRRVVVQPL